MLTCRFVVCHCPSQSEAVLVRLLQLAPCLAPRPWSVPCGQHGPVSHGATTKGKIFCPDFSERRKGLVAVCASFSYSHAPAQDVTARSAGNAPAAIEATSSRQAAPLPGRRPDVER